MAACHLVDMVNRIVHVWMIEIVRVHPNLARNREFEMPRKFWPKCLSVELEAHVPRMLRLVRREGDVEPRSS
jgi:hypothetical protein